VASRPWLQFADLVARSNAVFRSLRLANEILLRCRLHAVAGPLFIPPVTWIYAARTLVRRHRAGSRLSLTALARRSSARASPFNRVKTEIKDEV